MTAPRGSARVRGAAGVAFVMIAAIVTGCNHAGRSPAAATPSAPTSPATGDSSVNPALRPLVNVAIDDLAKRLGIDRTAITVSEARSMVWPDGSFGCPRPGMSYPQVQQEGVLIRLTVNGEEFNYHGGGSRAPFLCENRM